MSALVICDATIIDGRGDSPINGSILIENDRVRAIGNLGDLPVQPDTARIDARGKFVIPGLMNANVHLLGDTLVETLARYEGRYEDLIAEAAQVALKNGFTTLFDTWGPRKFLIRVREQIDAGKRPGARIYCAGNIIGFDGPFSPDFLDKAQDVTSTAFAQRINATWVENVGRRLMWMTPDQVAEQVRTYIGKGVDFVKFASNDHAPGAFLAFSPASQAAMVSVAHEAGLTAQAHTMSVEGLRIAVEAGCDLIQHANITGPVPIPDTTLNLMCARRTAAVIFPFTARRLETIMATAADRPRTMWEASDTNARKFIDSEVTLLLANDGALFAPEVTVDRLMANFWGKAGEDRLLDLSTGHVAWFKAMEEKGCQPMRMLQAATRNIAVAYQKDADLGTLESGKIADLVILSRNPLDAAANYACVDTVIKDGIVIDRDSLPIEPLLTRPLPQLTDEEIAYTPFFATGQRFPGCPACLSY